jgi:ABC-type phosphate/phosphonate transport system substrate-binding protein
MPEESVASDSAAGHRRFGEYELLEQIGRGGMGIVYKARQISLKRFVAIKMLGPHASAFPGIAQRLRLEAEAAAGLCHPHIVTIYDVGQHEGQPFFTMELIEGAGLDKFIGPDGFRAGPAQLDPDVRRNGAEAQAARLMIQIARAVDHAHKHGVLHRDLKPANVLIDAQGMPHLTDFGLAKILGRASVSCTASGAILGTPAYMAPEQASGETKHVTTAADIYSLGAILYEMLTGQPPFRAETPLETLRRVVEEAPKPPSTFNRNLDADLATICIKCLEKDPQHRYNAASSLAEDLERWLRGEPIEARSVRRLERAWRWCRREPVLATMTAGLGILLVATTIFALVAYRVSQHRLVEERRQREESFHHLEQRIAADWDDADRRFIRLNPEELEFLLGQPLTREGNETIIKLGVQLPGKDRSDPQMRINRGHPALAHYLRTALAPRAVLCDVFIYKNSSNAVEALVRGEVDIMQLSPGAYVEARRHNASVTPLVAQAHGGNVELRGAIFAHSQSGIGRLEAIKGRSFAFAEWDSAIGHSLPKLALLQAGLHLQDLRAWTNCRPWHAISLVREGHFEAGAADFEDVQKLIAFGAPLLLLKEVRSPGMVWVASTNLPSDLRAAIQQSLLSLNDPTLLAGISRGLTGFRPTNATNYDVLAQEIETANLFEQRP